MVDAKRLAKNTLLMYIRMILIMSVSIYTSRVVLEKLGVVTMDCTMQSLV